MEGKIFLSSAYLPPIEYFALAIQADEILIEREENYLKQSYRNRCYILSGHGPQLLSVPVYLGSVHKTPVKDIKIDYSKRWQQVHLRAISAAYSSTPYFEFYFEIFEKIISKNEVFLLDLNLNIIQTVLKILNITIKVDYTSVFAPVESVENDFRYNLTPKIKSDYSYKEYLQVFFNTKGFVPNLSIVDLLFNMGPEAVKYL